MSGQQSKGGQQYGQPYGQQGGSYSGPTSDMMYRLPPGQSFLPWLTDGSYFSQGGTARGSFAPQQTMYGMGGQGNPFQGGAGGGGFSMPGQSNPFQSNANPFQGAAGGGGFSMPGAPQAKPYVRPIDASVNPFQAPAQFGPTPPQNFDYTQTPTVPNTNDPNSPEYANYYNSLPASTRSYLAPPNSALANYIATNYNNSPFKF